VSRLGRRAGRGGLGHAGVELLCRFPLEPPAASDRIARSIQTLETLDDRSLLRYDDAWSP
jgi:hypothetical protein